MLLGIWYMERTFKVLAVALLLVTVAGEAWPQTPNIYGHIIDLPSVESFSSKYPRALRLSGKDVFDICGPKPALSSMRYVCRGYLFGFIETETAKRHWFATINAPFARDAGVFRDIYDPKYCLPQGMTIDSFVLAIGSWIRKQDEQFESWKYERWWGSVLIEHILKEVFPRKDQLNCWPW